jgi:tetratricopeptide (TPR) repeat protein
LALLLAGLTALTVSAGVSSAQSQSWRVDARTHSQAATSRALTQMAHNQVDSAVSSLVEATNADASDSLPFAVLGLALDVKGRYNEALDALHKSWELNSHDSETALSIGVTHYLMHNYEKAVNAWQKALELNHNLCHIHGDIGFAYMRMADLGKAEDHFRRLISCFPNSQFGYQGLATIQYLSGDFEAARRSAEHAQSILSYPPVILLLAKLDFLQGDRARALKRTAEYTVASKKPGWQRSMTAIGYPAQHDFKWDPFLIDNYDNAYLLQSRALDLPKEASRQKSLRKQGKAASIVAQVKAELGKSAGDYYLVRELALAELAGADYSDATEHFKQVVDTCRGCFVDWLHLGRALSLDGKAPEASRAVRHFQQKNPAQRLAGAFTAIARVDPGLGAGAVAPAELKRDSAGAGSESGASGKDGGF